MNVTRLRELAKRGGLIGLVGLVAAGAYVAWRMLVSSRKVALTAAVIVLCLVAWYAFSPQDASPHSALLDRQAQTDSFTDLGAPPEYEIVDLGTVGEGAIATGINNRGDVSGLVFISEEEVHGVVWQGGKMRDIGTLGGAWSIANDVNDGGHVIGLSETQRQLFRGFRWRDGKMQEVPSIDDGISVATGINARGDIAGFSTLKRETVVACLWQDGKPKPLQTPRNYAFGIADSVNDAGLVAGYAISEDMDSVHAVAWEGGKPRDLGTLGGEWSMAVASGPSGQIGGASQVSGGSDADWNACVWEGGRARDLGRLPEADWAMVAGINKGGDMIGASGEG